jgi:membrane protease YdiL (CAAX protease family)
MLEKHEANSKSHFGEWAAITFALVLPTLVTLLYFVWAEGHAPALRQGCYGIAKTIQFCFPLVWVWFVLKQRPKIWPWTARGIGLGVVFGLAIAAAMFALYHGWLKSSAQFVTLEKTALEIVSGMGLSLEKYILLSVFYSLIHSLLEEYYFRWFVYGQLKRHLSIWPAAIISGLGFMAHHVIVLAKYFGYASPTTWLFSAAIAIGGIAWAWLYQRSGSLLGPWISHLLVDAAIFAIGYEILKDHLGS